MNNCGSCSYKEKNCEYGKFRKSVESDIFHGDMIEIFELKCSKYKRRPSNKDFKIYKNLSGDEALIYKISKNDKLQHGQKVIIKTKETLIKEGYDITKQGVFKEGKMYLNESALEYLGWKMQVEFKDSEHYENENLKGYSLIVADFGFCELDMCNVETCMFEVINE